MIDEPKAIWTRLNWAKGLERAYYIVWALVAVKGVALFIEDRTFGIFSLLLLAVVIPFGVKQLAIWVAKGFRE